MSEHSKAVEFSFQEGFKDVEQFVNAELEYLSPYLKKIIKAFYNLNWGGEFDADSPVVRFTIDFRSGMDTGKGYARVFEFEFYTDSSENFLLYVNEWKGREMETENVAKVTLKFSEWGFQIE